MSLIFEALKKLEREKESPDRGVVVVAPGPWGEREPRSRSRTAAAIGLVLLGLGLGAFAMRSRTRAPESASAALSSPPTETPAAAPHETEVLRRSSDDVPPPSSRLSVPTGPAPRSAAPERAEPETIALTPPPDPVVSQEPEFRLNAISSREGQPVALLNDRLVREGDVFAGVRVLHIGEDYVEIEVKGEKRTIRF